MFLNNTPGLPLAPHLGTTPAQPPPSRSITAVLDPADGVDRVASLARQALSAVERVQHGEGVELGLDAGSAGWTGLAGWKSRRARRGAERTRGTGWRRTSRT